MSIIFEVIDKTGRKIHLSNERWRHIRKRHPEVEEYDSIVDALMRPDKVTNYHIDESIVYYYKYYKSRPSPDKYLLIVVKYLNGHGYVLTSYYEDKIR